MALDNSAHAAPPHGAAAPAAPPPIEDHFAFLATIPARPWDRQAALALGILSAIVCAVTIPYANRPGPALPSFISAYESVLIINDFITAILLLGQFHELRRPSLLVLACGYLFDSSIEIPHLLSYPGLFVPDGLIGGSQTTGWIYVFWHTLFPLFVIGYAVLAGRQGGPQVPAERLTRLTLLAAGGSLALAWTCAMLGAPWRGLLPDLLDRAGHVLPVGHVAVGAGWIMALVSIAVLVWRTRLRRVLDLWLAVTMGCWVLEILLGALLISHRFELGFYVGRVYGLLASSFILAVMLFQTIGLHGRLARSVTVMRAQAEELARSESALRQSQKLEAIGQLTGGVAHDFNNLLTGIVGSLEMLDREIVTPRGRKLIDVAQRSAWRGAKLTGQLLALARKQRLVSEPLDMNVVVEGMEGLLGSTLGGGVRVETALQPGLWLALADRTQLELAVLNLAINARDAMPAGGAIVFATANVTTGKPTEPEGPPAGEHVCLTVTDCGEGMAQDVLAHVFEPYFTTKGPGRGSGLGLPQVLGVAKQLGGGMAIETRLGHGTSVRLYLPRATVDAAQDTAAAEATPGSLKGASVLLVDDDNLVRATEREMLEDLGCTVIETDSGLSALDAAASAVAMDLALIDFAMPGMNGIETARRMRALRPGIAIVFATGDANAIEMVGGASVGEIMAKPLRQADLAARLAPLVRHRA